MKYAFVFVLVLVLVFVQEWCPRWPGLAQLPGQMVWGLRRGSGFQMVYRWIPMGPCMSPILTIIKLGWSHHLVRAVMAE